MDKLTAVESIFFAALDRDSPGERAAYLEQACGGDQELRRHVERLLSAHPKVGSFLEKPKADEGATGAYTRPPDEAGGAEQPGGADILVGREPGRQECPPPGGQTFLSGNAAEGPGTRIGPYKLLQEIGEGGMGTVYMAEQQEPVRRLVALKIIKAGMDSREVVARFQAERQALALMDHPNIAKVLDAGTTSTGRLFFVMELVKGIPITKYCDEHRLTPRERLELFMPVCHALQHAHQKGIIHRDIKPSNVLVAPYDGKPVIKVIDFGVAKATGQRLTEKTMFTEFGAVIGTLEYMSPEQAELNNQDIDTRSDIYSLGVLLYELLTGTTPLDRNRLKKAAFTEMLRIIREEEPPRPSMRLSGSNELPSISAQRQTDPAKLSKLMRGDLDWIVMKSLEKDRVRRYETANGLARDIDRYLKDEAVEACPPSAGYRMKKFLRRNKAPAIAAAMVLAALILGAGISAWQAVRATQAEEVATLEWDRAEKERARAVGAEGQANAERDNAQKARDAEKERAGELAVALKEAEAARLVEQQTREKAEEDLATSTMMLARSRFDEQNVALAEELLAHVPAKFRGSGWALLKNYVAGSLFVLYGHTGQVTRESFSPDGQMLATASEDNTVRLWDAKSGQELHVLKGHTDTVTDVHFSPNGHVLASAGDNTVRLWNPKSGQELQVLKGHTDIVTDMRFSPNGHVLASAGDNTVRLWDAKSGQELHVLKGHTDPVISVSFSPDGQVLASAGIDKTVRLWDANSGQELRVLKAHTAAVNSVSFCPDGQVLASASSDKTVRLWDAKSGEEMRVLKGHKFEVISVSYSPDGQTLASASLDRTVRLWDAKNGEVRWALTGHTGFVNSVSFSPNCQELATASGDNTVRLWDVKTGQELRVVKGHTDIGLGGFSMVQYGVRSVSFSPNGQLLASAGSDKTVRLWVAGSGQELRRMRHIEMVSSVSFSRDGRTVASASWDKSVRLWDAKSGQELQGLKGHTGYVRGVSFSPDDLVLASAGFDNTVRLWDAKTGQELRVLKGHTLAVSAVSFSPDGQTLASASGDKTVRLWDVKTGQQLRVLKGHSFYVTHVSFSPDGHVLASASMDSRVILWDPQTGKELGTLKGHNGTVNSLSFSPDGKVLATGSEDSTVRLWGVKTGQELRVLRGHAVFVQSVSYSPDGQTLASASDDGTVRVWDPHSGQELRVLKGHASGVTSVSYSPDGQTLASASGDGTVRLWDVRSAWTGPGDPISPSELAFRRWVTTPVPELHVEKRIEAEKDKNAFAAAFHRSWEQHARGVLAFEAGDFNMAYAHFIAAAALKPKAAPNSKSAIP